MAQGNETCTAERTTEGGGVKLLGPILNENPTHLFGSSLHEMTLDAEARDET